MRYAVLLVALLSLSAVAFLPLPLPGTIGMYNSWSGLIWCTSELTCMHEVGHKLDDMSGWVSSTPEFQAKIRKYEFDSLLPDDPLMNKQAELYAMLFSISHGDPERVMAEFRPFYNWILAQQLIQEYVR